MTPETPDLPTPADPEPRRRPGFALSPSLVIGIVVIFLGVVFMLDSLNILDRNRVLSFWPAILLVIGLIKIRSSRGSATGGYVLTAIGAFLLLVNLGGGSVIGPLILVAVGIAIVLHALKRHRGVPPELQRAEGFVRGNAIFSAFEHRLRSQAFRGGEVTALFGGFDVDLRQTAMEGPTARLDTFVMFGGGDLRVPEGWEVQVQAAAGFGGGGGNTLPVPAASGPRPRLLVTGLVLFGGVEIKN